jgi:hypothetical protein
MCWGGEGTNYVPRETDRQPASGTRLCSSASGCQHAARRTDWRVAMCCYLLQGVEWMQASQMPQGTRIASSWVDMCVLYLLQKIICSAGMIVLFGVWKILCCLVVCIYILWHLDSLLGNGSVNTFPQQRIRIKNRVTAVAMQRHCRHAFPTIERLSYKEQFGWELLVEFRDANLTGYELGSRRTELSRVFGIDSCRIMARKEFRLCKEDFMCDLKLQWNGYKSVARILLVKPGNPNACLTVNCKVCRSAIALYCL